VRPKRARRLRRARRSISQIPNPNFQVPIAKVQRIGSIIQFSEVSYDSANAPRSECTVHREPG
jgi:hypothetical protein